MVDIERHRELEKTYASLQTHVRGKGGGGKGGGAGAETCANLQTQVRGRGGGADTLWWI